MTITAGSLDAGPGDAGSGDAEAEAPLKAGRGYWHGVGARLLSDKVAMLAACVLLLIILAAILAPWVAPADPYKGSMIRRLKPFGFPGYPLGADELGRDMLTRLIHGGRLSLLMGVMPVVIAFAIGSTIGIVAGSIGGWLNTILMRTIDVFFAFPSVLLAIALSGVLGAGIVNSIVSLTVVFIPQIARVAESVTTQIRSRDFVEAARISGASTWAIIRVHVLGNVLGPVFVYATSLISVSMILASGLSFLGLGSKPPEPEWGLMRMRQRAMIALALSCRPKVLLADEPTTALDATVQIQVLLLLRELQRELGLGVIFVTHDIGVAVEVADRIAVMYAGRIVEQGSCRDVIRAPAHPYTRALLHSRAGDLVAKGSRLPAIPGAPPDPATPPPGCAFAPRRGSVTAACRVAMPDAKVISPGHAARCIL